MDSFHIYVLVAFIVVTGLFARDRYSLLAFAIPTAFLSLGYQFGAVLAPIAKLLACEAARSVLERWAPPVEPIVDPQVAILEAQIRSQRTDNKNLEATAQRLQNEASAAKAEVTSANSKVKMLEEANKEALRKWATSWDDCSKVYQPELEATRTRIRQLERQRDSSTQMLPTPPPSPPAPPRPIEPMVRAKVYNELFVKHDILQKNHENLQKNYNERGHYVDILKSAHKKAVDRGSKLELQLEKMEKAKNSQVKANVTEHVAPTISSASAAPAPTPTPNPTPKPTPAQALPPGPAAVISRPQPALEAAKSATGPASLSSGSIVTPGTNSQVPGAVSLFSVNNQPPKATTFSVPAPPSMAGQASLAPGTSIFSASGPPNSAARTVGNTTTASSSVAPSSNKMTTLFGNTFVPNTNSATPTGPVIFAGGHPHPARPVGFAVHKSTDNISSLVSGALSTFNTSLSAAGAVPRASTAASFSAKVSLPGGLSASATPAAATVASSSAPAPAPPAIGLVQSAPIANTTTSTNPGGATTSVPVKERPIRAARQPKTGRTGGDNTNWVTKEDDRFPSPAAADNYATPAAINSRATAKQVAVANLRSTKPRPGSKRR